MVETRKSGGTVIDIATSLAASTALAYASGWIYLYCYYGSFRARWLVHFVSASEVLSAGGVTLALLTGTITVYLSDLLRKPSDVPPFHRSKIRTTLFLTGIGFVIAGVSSLAVDLGWQGVVGYGVTTVLLIYALGCLHIAISFYRAGAERKWSARWASSFALFGLILFPTAAGLTAGHIHRDAQYSELPILQLSDTTAARAYRALLVSQERVFAVDLEDDYHVIPLEWEQIGTIRTPIP